MKPSHTLVLALISIVLGSCGEGVSDRRGGRLDSNTNWLRSCASNAECGSELACECGICTVLCDTSSDCDSEIAVCAQEALLPTVCQSRLGGLCVESCDAALTCRPGFMCETGACTPTPQTADHGDAGIDVDEGEPDAGPSQTDVSDIDATNDDGDVETSTDTDNDAAAEFPCAPGIDAQCGDGESFPEDVLVVCTDEGVLEVTDTCDVDCVPFEGSDDVCLDACPDTRPFCGQTEGLHPGIIFLCDELEGVTIQENCTGVCLQPEGEGPLCQ